MCPACEDERVEALREGDLSVLLFSEAADLWLEGHRAYISPRTIKDYEQYLVPLKAFFGALRVNQINIGNIRSYHAERLLSAGALRVRMESSTLRQIMTEAGVWKHVKAVYKHPPLSRREKDGAGQSFTLEQEDNFVRVGLSLTRCELAAHCAQVMFKSGFGFGELRRVRRSEFDDEQQTITIVDGAKNSERERTIPLTYSAFESAKWILARWQDAGGTAPNEYLLFYRKRGKSGPDFYRPMVSIQNGWNKITKECIKLGYLPEGFHRRIYDCRVTAVTKALSSGKVSLHTAQKLFGHVSRKMQQRYYKPHLDVLRDAVQVLESPPKPGPQPALVQKAAAKIVSS